jgi:hypothetical protein
MFPAPVSCLTHGYSRVSLLTRLSDPGVNTPLDRAFVALYRPRAMIPAGSSSDQQSSMSSSHEMPTPSPLLDFNNGLYLAAAYLVIGDVAGNSTICKRLSGTKGGSSKASLPARGNSVRASLQQTKSKVLSTELKQPSLQPWLCSSINRL